MKRIAALALVCALLLTLSGCGVLSAKDTVLEKARLAWSKTMGTRTPDSTVAVSHIEFTSQPALAESLGIDITRCSFTTSGLFADSGHLFGIMQSGKLQYIVAMDLEGKITWIFAVQPWTTREGRSRLSSLEFTIMATSVANGVKAVYPEAESVGSDTWHRLTDKQIESLVE